ncbi:ornithine-acyl-ACP acyltransferase [Maritimibacter sp. 55A14]|uniref:GNAT family N-acetyltransferase n=1 Tax=Maritimibacter sp. 55A14 TaxID=2174844 RepID=UPI000D60D7F3|nr:GNAT family N-acyltransferase [Maritimibacter sp. 55A14]PWE33059.1 ornithine-acyl-ACP acyltransferase [Maritimibacter sp. 55A14]
MHSDDRHFELRLARSERDLKAAQRLRYEVFVEELGGDGPGVDHAARLESDRHDPYFDHLLLIDRRRDAEALEDVVGVYRLLKGADAERAGGFYSAAEYDLTPLLASGRSLLELGRSCVHADYRGGTAMYYLWNALAAYVQEHGIEIMFGVASFHGTDVDALAQPLAFLYHNYLAPEDIRVRVHDHVRTEMNRIPADRVDRRTAMQETPALIKAYLRLGGFVGDGAYVDHAFNTTDVCLLMDTARMSERHRSFYVRSRGS